MKILQGLLALCLIAAAMASPSQTAVQQVSQAATQFSNNFYLEVARKTQGNLICSPLSADIVLAMVAYGSGGNTEQQFNQVLHLPQPQELGRAGYRSLIAALNDVKDVVLKVANKVFVNVAYPLKDSYKAITHNDFHSTSQQLNFAQSVESADTINNWVADNTNDRIKDIVQSGDLNADTAMVLVNAIYFKGKWQVEFDKTFTTLKTFHLSKTESIKVPTMFKEADFKTGNVPGVNAKFIELPYKGNELRMLVILPNEIGGLAEVESKLHQVDLNSLLASSIPQTVRLYIPKFKIESKIELNDHLQNMGLTDMFSAQRANFSGISNVPTYVSKVVQKAFIEVNEEGSEAAAATEVVLVGYSLSLTPTEPIEFRVDRPFYYMIYHKPANVVLFQGHTFEPKSE